MYLNFRTPAVKLRRAIARLPIYPIGVSYEVQRNMVSTIL